MEQQKTSSPFRAPPRHPTPFKILPSRWFKQPWPSKIPDPWRSPTTISKGHVFTIPRRSQRIARVVFWEKKNSTKFVFCFLRSVLDYCYRIFSLPKSQAEIKAGKKNPGIFRVFPRVQSFGCRPGLGVWCRCIPRVSHGNPSRCDRHLSVRTVMACFNICVVWASRRREVFWWVLWFDWFF